MDLVITIRRVIHAREYQFDYTNNRTTNKKLSMKVSSATDHLGDENGMDGKP